jgi:hypothetical protein
MRVIQMKAVCIFVWAVVLVSEDSLRSISSGVCFRRMSATAPMGLFLMPLP